MTKFKYGAVTSNTHVVWGIIYVARHGNELFLIKQSKSTFILTNINQLNFDVTSIYYFASQSYCRNSLGLENHGRFASVHFSLSFPIVIVYRAAFEHWRPFGARPVVDRPNWNVYPATSAVLSANDVVACNAKPGSRFVGL